MRTIDITTPQNVTIEYELADLKDRIAAFAIDSIVLWSSILIIYSLFLIAFPDGSFDTLQAVIIYTIFFFYTLSQEIFFNGQTLGKRGMNLRVVHLNGRPPHLSDYLIRWSCRMIDIYFSFGAVASILSSSTTKGQRLGGLLSNTTVVKEKAGSGFKLEDILRIKTLDDYQPTFPNVKSCFTEEDMLLIKKSLERAKKYRNIAHFDAVFLLANKVASALGVAGPERKNSVAFLRQVLKDYIVLTR